VFVAHRLLYPVSKGQTQKEKNIAPRELSTAVNQNRDKNAGSSFIFEING